MDSIILLLFFLLNGFSIGEKVISYYAQKSKRFYEKNKLPKMLITAFGPKTAHLFGIFWNLLLSLLLLSLSMLKTDYQIINEILSLLIKMGFLFAIYENLKVFLMNILEVVFSYKEKLGDKSEKGS